MVELSSRQRIISESCLCRELLKKGRAALAVCSIHEVVFKSKSVMGILLFMIPVLPLPIIFIKIYDASYIICNKTVHRNKVHSL